MNHRMPRSSPLSDRPDNRLRRSHVTGKIGSSRSPSPIGSDDESRRRHHNDGGGPTASHTLAPPLQTDSDQQQHTDDRHPSPEPRIVEEDTLLPHHRRRQVEAEKQKETLRRSIELQRALDEQVESQRRARREAFEREMQEDALRMQSSSNVFGSRGSFPTQNSFARVERRDSVPPAMGPEHQSVPPAPRTTPSNSSPQPTEAYSAVRSSFEPLVKSRRAAVPAYGANSSNDNVLKNSGATPSPIPHDVNQSYELFSPGNVFDHERRAHQDLVRRQTQQRHQEELRAELEKQIALKEAQRLKARQEEERLDRQMQERAEREQNQRLDQQRRREELQNRMSEEAKQQNEEIRLAKERRMNQKDQPSDSVSRQRRNRSPDRAAEITEDKSSGDAGPNHHRHDTELQNQMLALLSEIRDEMSKSRPLPELYQADRNRTPTPTPPMVSVPSRDGPYNLMRTTPPPTNSFNNEAQLILERNRARLAALRQTQSHDDILKAFLLRDATAAQRALEGM